MQELLRNAWLGWLRYTENGKIVAILLAVLLFLWFGKKEWKEKSADWLLWYTTIMVVCCIFPVSAVFLMKYQTSFYNYEWIWCFVPVTMVTAYGITVFLTNQWESYLYNIEGKQEVKKLRCVGITILTVVVLALCGNMGQHSFKGYEEVKAQEHTGLVLENLMQEEPEGGICLWAPKEIMASARALNGNIRLIYGRNMWDAALGAYSYETYTEVEELLYLWMCNLEETGSMEGLELSVKDSGEGVKKQVITVEQCMQTAVTAGVNRILLPGNILPEELQQLESLLGVQARQVEGYFVFMIP